MSRSHRTGRRSTRAASRGSSASPATRATGALADARRVRHAQRRELRLRRRRAHGDHRGHRASTPTGSHIYVAARDRLVVFDRQPLSGGLTLVQCLKTGGGSGCVDVPDLGLALTGITVAPDGRTVYVTRGGANHVLSLRRDPATGLLTPLGCVSFDADPAAARSGPVHRRSRSRPRRTAATCTCASYEGTGAGAFGAVASFRAAQAPVCQGRSGDRRGRRDHRRCR